MSKNLSLFHEEILKFLKNNTVKRISVEGFDETQDPALKDFQQSLEDGLSPKGSDDPLPLMEIIDDYHYLFETRGPLHLEKKLLEAFPSQEGKGNGLRIYRGLPRLYRSGKPMDSRIKKDFIHLPTLKRLIGEKELFQLYSKTAVTSFAKVSFFSWVIGDGWGDYINTFESIEILRERFPELQISWVVLFPRHLQPSPPIPRGCKTHLIFYEKEVPISLIDQEALEILRTSSLVLQMASYYPATYDVQQALKQIPLNTQPPVWISIGEYGFLESSYFHPMTGNGSMGLHFLEKGILTSTHRQRREVSFSEVENQELLEWLFGLSEPGPAEIEKYRQKAHFYFAYLTSPVGGAVYLHALIKAHEMDKKEIDICSPSLLWLSGYIELQNRAGRPPLEIEGIGLEVYYQGKFCSFIEGEVGKKVRIFCPNGLSSSDFRMLVQLSEEFVAVRGNQSYSEVVSANKGFFYDGRDHSRYFIKDMLAIAENRIGMHRSCLEVFRAMGKTHLYNLPPVKDTDEWVEETYFQEKQPWIEIALKIGVALQDPDCIVGFKKLNRMIAEEKSINDFLCHLVQRQLCFLLHPNIQSAEEEELAPFLNGNMNWHKALENVKKRLYDGRVFKGEQETGVI